MRYGIKNSQTGLIYCSDSKEDFYSVYDGKQIPDKAYAFYNKKFPLYFCEWLTKSTGNKHEVIEFKNLEK